LHKIIVLLALIYGCGDPRDSVVVNNEVEMKGVLVFKLPEEKELFDECQKGGMYLSHLQDIDNFIRGKLKYDNTLNKKTVEVLEEIRSRILEVDIWN